MRPEIRTLLTDMQLAIQRIEEFCIGAGWDDYSQDLLLQSAVERQLMILGEALFRISKLDDDWQTWFAAARQIVRFRHVLVHGYETIGAMRVWRVVTDELPTVKQELTTLLGDPDHADA